MGESRSERCAAFPERNEAECFQRSNFKVWKSHKYRWVSQRWRRCRFVKLGVFKKRGMSVICCLCSSTFLWCLFTDSVAAAADHEWIANATGNLTQVEDLDCPQSSETSERIVAEFSFWVEGITQVTRVISSFFYWAINAITFTADYRGNPWDLWQYCGWFYFITPWNAKCV